MKKEIADMPKETLQKTEMPITGDLAAFFEKIEKKIDSKFEEIDQKMDTIRDEIKQINN